MFSVNNVKPYVPALQFKAAQLADTVANTSGDNSEVEGWSTHSPWTEMTANTLPVETGIWKATLDLIGVKALGTDLNHLQSSDVRLHNLFSRTMQQSFTSHIIHYFSSYLPLRHILPIKANNEFVRDTRETRRIIQHHLESRQKSGVGDKEGNLDALQIMAEKGNLWDDDEAIEHVSQSSLFVLKAQQLLTLAP